MLKTGDICPLFFQPQVKDVFAIDIDYVQRFYISDNILLQLFDNNSGSSPTASIINLYTGTSSSLAFTTYEVNEDVRMFYTNISGYAVGYYKVNIQGIGQSEPFLICDDPALLDSTCLFEFSHKDNNSPFDNIFWIGEKQQIFQIRVEGGFKPSGINFAVDNEQFRNPWQEIVETHAVPYSTYALTLGDACGLPVWFGDVINRLLCLSVVLINGVAYRRSENSIPEKEPISDYHQTFNFSILLERSQNNIAGIKGESEPDDNGSFAAILSNPREGEVLVYRENNSAFVNTNDL